MVTIFSPRSDIKIFELKDFCRGLKKMLNDIGSKEASLDARFEESQFGLTLSSNLQGQIKIEVIYRSWGEQDGGQLKFSDQIDQSYLPQIIKELESILANY